MGSNLSVKITADIVDLQSKFAIAKAEVTGLSTELNKLARASASGIVDPVSQARLQQVAGDFAAAKTQAAALGGALGQASGGVLGFSGHLGEAHESVATMGREIRKLFTEIKDGSAGGADVTLVRIAQSMLGLGPAALIGVGAVAGLGAGLAYLGIQATNASKALDQAFLGAQFAGNLGIAREAIKQYTDEMSRASNISASEAQQIAKTLSSIPGITEPTFHALTSQMSDLIAVTGKGSGPKVAEDLAKIFSAKTSAEEYARSLGGITQGQIDMAIATDRSGNAIEAQNTKVALLLPTIGRSTSTIDQNKTKLTESIGAFLSYAGAMASATSFEEIQNDVIAQSNKARQAQLDVLKQTAAAQSSIQQSPDQALQHGLELTKQENPMALQIEEAKAKVATLAAELNKVKDTASQANLELLNAGLQSAQEKLAALQFGPALEKMRADMAQVAATWDGTQAGMLAKQIQIAAATLASVKGNSKEELAVETELSRLKVQARQAAGTEAIATAREEISQIGAVERQGAMQRLEAERDVWQQVLATARLTASQRVEVERSLNQTLSAITREGAQETQTTARQDAAADIAIARLKIDAAKSAIDLSAAADSAAIAAKLARLRQFTAEEFALDEQALEAELETLKEQPVAYNAVYNQIRELKQKLVNDLEALDRQAAEAAKKEAKEQASDWKGAVGEIEGAESGMVSDLLNKRKSLSASLLSIGAELVTKEIANDLRAVTTRLLLQDSAQVQQKAIEQGGFLYHALVESQSTAATAASQQAQTAATITGNSARLSATESAAAAAKSAGAATGGATVMAVAAMAFSGTYASVAQIPYVGWILAPAAAAAAFAAVAAYEGLASFDVGTNYVPHDMTARIHQGEAIVPKAYNPAAGGSFAGAGGGASGGQTHLHMHLSAFNSAGMSDLVHSSDFRDAIVQSFGKYLNRGGRG